MLLVKKLIPGVDRNGVDCPEPGADTCRFHPVAVAYPSTFLSVETSVNEIRSGRTERFWRLTEIRVKSLQNTTTTTRNVSTHVRGFRDWHSPFVDLVSGVVEGPDQYFIVVEDVQKTPKEFHGGHLCVSHILDKELIVQAALGRSFLVTEGHAKSGEVQANLRLQRTHVGSH